jgi:hypothetical protein
MRTCAIIHPLHLELETALYIRQFLEPFSLHEAYQPFPMFASKLSQNA